MITTPKYTLAYDEKPYLISVSYLKIFTRLRRTPNGGWFTETNFREHCLWWSPCRLCWDCQRMSFTFYWDSALGNSFVNPFVHSFRNALQRLWRKRRRNVEIRPGKRSRNKINLRSVTSVATTNGDWCNPYCRHAIYSAEGKQWRKSSRFQGHSRFLGKENMQILSGNL